MPERAAGVSPAVQISSASSTLHGSWKWTPIRQDGNPALEKEVWVRKLTFKQKK